MSTLARCGLIAASTLALLGSAVLCWMIDRSGAGGTPEDARGLAAVVLAILGGLGLAHARDHLTSREAGEPQ